MWCLPVVLHRLRCAGGSARAFGLALVLGGPLLWKWPLLLLPARILWHRFCRWHSPLLRLLHQLPLVQISLQLHCLLPLLHGNFVWLHCSNCTNAVVLLPSCSCLLRILQRRLLRLPNSISSLCWKCTGRLLPVRCYTHVGVRQLRRCCCLQGHSCEPGLLGVCCQAICSWMPWLCLV